MDVTHAATGVALLGRDTAWAWARQGLVTGLATVIAQALVARAVLGDVAHYAMTPEVNFALRTL